MPFPSKAGVDQEIWDRRGTALGARVPPSLRQSEKQQPPKIEPEPSLTGLPIVDDLLHTLGLI